MYYQINAYRDGLLKFATSPRTLRSVDAAKGAFDAISAIYSRFAGYEVSVIRVQRGYPVSDVTAAFSR